ncbi:hypothetical protein WKI71_28235 [Streptomyces sp. MS1.AVA.1]|uniref:Uncharacterized protein n=1 Tax=Streptomyces machairae TaxID=3134109 RepID=A0ABU8URV2_9ACTN
MRRRFPRHRSSDRQGVLSGELPDWRDSPGFAFTESGGLIHYKYGIVLAVPAANQANWSGDMWISFGSAWGMQRSR